MKTKCKLYNDRFQNFEKYEIPKAQLMIADIPYNLGKNAYASNPEWWKDGDSSQGESEKANTQFFDADIGFDVDDFMKTAAKMMLPEPNEVGKAPAMIVFCAYEQMQLVEEAGKRHGFKKSYPIFFIKKSSPQVLKSNMRIVGAMEYAVVLYREKLPKFNNNGKMILNYFNWDVDRSHAKIHPTQKPIPTLKELIRIFTDRGDVIIDPVAGSGSSLRAAAELGRHAYGFEIEKKFYEKSKSDLLKYVPTTLF